MGKKVVIVSYAALFVFTAVLFLLQAVFFGGFTITGFSIFEDSGGNFSNGTFEGVVYNGSSVVLSGNNLSGNYTSQVFNAGSDAFWNNISLNFSVPNQNNLYAVDGNGEVYSSNDSGVTWEQKTSDYGRGSSTEELFGDNDYIYIVFGGTAREIWRSTDFGASWSVVNDSFADSNLRLGEISPSGNLFVADSSGDVYMSDDQGTTWTLKGDFNGGASNDGLGMAINSAGDIFVVDGSGSVWKSVNSGTSWTEASSGYGGGSATDDMEVDSNGDLFILINTEIYRSSNDGASWSVFNDSISPYSNSLVEMFIDSNDNFYILDAIGRVFRSTNNGLSWTEEGDFNGGSSTNPKGIGDFNLGTNLTYQFRNCSSPDCSDGSFVGPDGTSGTVYSDAESTVNLTGQYFQYKAFFDSDSVGLNPNLDSVSIDYSLVAVTPNVTILLPDEEVIYGNNDSIPLNFSLIGNNIESCWYNINNGSNMSIPNCGNITLGVGSSGSYDLIVYANESSLGLIGNDSVSFTVQRGAPDISVISPVNNKHTNQTNLSFIYNATSDFGVDTCQFWGNFDGTYSLNQTNQTSSGELGSFDLGDLSNQTYLWSIYCNNTEGVIGTTGNYTLVVDTNPPLLDLFEPNGSYNHTEDIPLNYSVNDTESSIDSCVYKLSFSAGGQPVEVKIISGCSTTSLDVSTETDYSLLLTVNDTAGNTGSKQTSFTVDTGNGGGGNGGNSGSSASGGGGSSGLPSPVLAYSNLPNITIRRGQDSVVSFTIINNGVLFLDNCELEFSGQLSEIVSNKQIESLSPGQKVSYLLSLNVPYDFGVGDYNLNTKVVCDQSYLEVPLTAKVISGDFNFLINSVERDGTKLVLDYNLTDLSGNYQEISVDYSLNNKESVSVVQGESKLVLEANQETENVLEFELPKDLLGEYTLFLDLKTETDSFLVTKKVFLSSSGLTGLAISDSNRSTLSIAFVVFAILVILFFGLRFLKKHRKKLGFDKNSKRNFIKLNLKE